jgi:hypothetical protein
VPSGIISGLDWFPTLTAMAGNPDVKDQLLKGVVLNGKNFHVHLDGYDQTPMLTAKVRRIGTRSGTSPRLTSVPCGWMTGSTAFLLNRRAGSAHWCATTSLL